MLPDRWQNDWLPKIQADLARFRLIELSELAHDELAQVLHDTLAWQIDHWRIHAHMGSIPLSAVQRLIDWYLHRFPEAPETEPHKLLQGQSNTSVENGHRLWKLSQMVTPAIAALLRPNDLDALPAPFGPALDDHLKLMWWEVPSHLAQLVLKCFEDGVSDPYIEIDRLSAERDAFTQIVRSKLSAVDSEKFELLLACARENNPLTEDHAFWLDQQSSAVIHEIVAEFGRRLTQFGILDAPPDVCYLMLDEFIWWGFGLVDPIRPRVAARKVALEVHRQLTPPNYIGAAPEPAEPLHQILIYLP